MLLKLEDISVFKANWDNKADNIRQIAGLLNIGLDSIVYVDDNPAERELVSTFLPQVAVPAVPDDPSRYRQTLDQHRYFETIGISAEDGKRTEYYRSNISRESLKKDFFDLASYLKSLEMEATIGTFDQFHLPRVVQLINKSNQFHLTTTRYSENEVKELGSAPGTVCRHFSLKDKFGDNGLISVVILKKYNEHDWVIDTWCMSCRVLSRGMEEFICQTMIDLGRKKGIKRLVGIYIPTAKNGLVADLYPRLGFSPLATLEKGTTHWELNLGSLSQQYTTYIRTVKKEGGGADVSS
jgi:FkbH-like protein